MIRLFTPFAQQFDVGLNTAVSHVVTAALAGCAQELDAALVIFIVIQGALIAFRRYDYWSGLTNMLRAACVGLLVTAGYYAAYIQTPFLSTLPNWIAHVVNGGSGAQEGAQQFDLLLSATDHFAAKILLQTAGIFQIGTRIEVIVAVVCDVTAIGIAFVIWELASFMTGLVICVGPFVLIGFLFAATRPIAERWVSKLVGLLMLQLMIAVLLQVLIAGNIAYIQQAQMTPGNGVAEQVVTLINIAAFAGMSALMAILVPGVAAYIGGGVSMNFVSSLVSAPARLATRMG